MARWWQLLFLAALVLLLGAGAAVLLKKKGQAPVAPAAVTASACPEALVQPRPVLVGAESAKALVVGGPNVRLELDGAAAYAGPDAPGELAPGRHQVKARAGEQEVMLELEVEAYRPVLVHADLDAEGGLSVVFLGAACASCVGVDSAPPLGTRASKTPRSELLKEAFEALQTSDWRGAQNALEGIAPAQRTSPGFFRALAFIQQATRQPTAARVTLGKVKTPQLQGLLKAYSVLEDGIPAAMGQLALSRWNLLTERYGRLNELSMEAPGAVASATQRFSELSAGYLRACEANDVQAQVDAVAAAHETINAMVKGLRGAHPADCAFQRRVTAAF